MYKALIIFNFNVFIVDVSDASLHDIREAVKQFLIEDGMWHDAELTDDVLEEITRALIFVNIQFDAVEKIYEGFRSWSSATSEGECWAASEQTYAIAKKFALYELVAPVPR